VNTSCPAFTSVMEAGTTFGAACANTLFAGTTDWIITPAAQSFKNSRLFTLNLLEKLSEIPK
jgi:hypothetical protein